MTPSPEDEILLTWFVVFHASGLWAERAGPGCVGWGWCVFLKCVLSPSFRSLCRESGSRVHTQGGEREGSRERACDRTAVAATIVKERRVRVEEGFEYDFLRIFFCFLRSFY